MKLYRKLMLMGALLVGGLSILNADTTTNRTGLTKPSIGSANWGAKLNTNYDIIDSTFAALGSSNTFLGTQVFSSTLTANGPLVVTSSMNFTGAILQANFPMNSKLLTGLAAGSAAGNSVRYEQLKILSVSMATVDGASTTAVTSGFVDTSLSGTITLSSTSSKVLIIVSGTGAQSNSGEETRFTIARDGNNLGGTNGFCRVSGATTNLNAPLAITYLDSPSSTSLLTYKVRFFVTAGTGTFGFTNGRSVMILAEVNGF